LCVFRNLVRQELQGDKAVKLYILSFVDYAHAAAAQLLNDAVVRDGVPDHWRRILLLRNDQVNESRDLGGPERIVGEIATSLTIKSKSVNACGC